MIRRLAFLSAFCTSCGSEPWRVVARTGDSGSGKVVRWEFDTEDEVRQMARRLVQADGGAVDPAHGSARSEFD
ncbi:hypothetical protein ACSNN7_05950 [Micromonospora sp. URMC 105]|uniref:hypothetical protein n=1 Tax=Micromonospora sp. URMC 105 TaxID=3423413 RepID=UPI003F1C91B4